MIDKGVCDKGFIWNPSNCECECCDFCEYLDYIKIVSVKRVVNEETGLVEINSTECNSVENKCKTILVRCTLVAIFFIFIGI